MYEYIALEIALPMIHSLLSFAITMYLIVALVRSKRDRSGLMKGAGSAISVLEASNVLTLLAIDIAHLVIFLPYSFLTCIGFVATALNYTVDFTWFSVIGIFIALWPVPLSLTFLFTSFAAQNSVSRSSASDVRSEAHKL